MAGLEPGSRIVAGKAVRRGPRERDRTQPAPGRDSSGLSRAGGVPSRPRPRDGDRAEPPRSAPPDSFLDAVWNGDHVDRVEILWEETLALEGRAGYYDAPAHSKDVLQNHMLQILGLLAMEPLARPTSRTCTTASSTSSARSCRSRVPTLPSERAERVTRPGSSRTEPPSQAMPTRSASNPNAATETFAEVMLELDAERWAGTCFMLRAGKALSRRRKLAVVRFRTGEELRVGVDGPEDVNLELGGGQLVLSAPPPASELPAYGRVLLDVLDGGTTLSVGAEAFENPPRHLADDAGVVDHQTGFHGPTTFLRRPGRSRAVAFHHHAASGSADVSST